MNNIVLHIPHSSLKLPYGFYKNTICNKKIIKAFNKDITDLYTKELFGKNKYPKIITKYSRIYCDVEKFANDNDEIMSQFGMGVIYTKTNKGVEFNNPSTNYKNNILNTYYLPHHNKLDNIVEKLLNNKTILIDCHSFSKEIIMFEDKKQDLPDICIGFYNDYYSEPLTLFIKSYFESLGYSVKFNYPYSGTIVPNKFFKTKTNNLFCVMIEINKNLYLNKNNKKNSKFKMLRNQIQTLFKQLENLKI